MGNIIYIERKNKENVAQPKQESEIEKMATNAKYWLHPIYLTALKLLWCYLMYEALGSIYW